MRLWATGQVGRALAQLRNEPDPLLDLVSVRKLARADR